MEAFRAVVEQMRSAKRYADLFGVLPGDHISRKRSLRKSFAYLVTQVHPDHVPEMLKREATASFQKLNELRRGAEAALENNTYDQLISHVAATAYKVEIASAKRAYTIAEAPFKEGDFSALYRGKCDIGEIIAKIALEPSCNQWLEREANLLAPLVRRDHRDAAHPLSPYLPEVEETFILPESGKHFRVNIMRCVPDLVSVADIIAAFPSGLEPPQAAWVSRRVIAQTIAAQMLGVVHSAMTPDHVLVDPYKHEPLHIGWAHALSDPRVSKSRIMHIVDRWRDIYPPEVFDKKPVDHRSDIYMAGATLVRLLGGDVLKRTLPSSVPDRMAEVTLRAIEHSPAKRPQDGKQYLDEYTRVVRGIWGRVYRPLVMPV